MSKIRSLFLLINTLGIFTISAKSLIYQSKLELFVGIWKEILLKQDYYENRYIIIKKHNDNDLFLRILFLAYTNDKDNYDLYLDEAIAGFQDKFQFEEEIDNEFNKNIFKKNGEYLTIIYSTFDIDKQDYLKSSDVMFIYNNIEFDDMRLTLYSSNLFEYTRINKTEIPFLMIRLLYEEDKEKDKNYIKEYLDIEVKEIKKEKCYVYDEEKNKTVAELKKGDIVVILEQRREWIKVEYGEGYKQGWIKRECIE